MVLRGGPHHHCQSHVGYHCLWISPFATHCESLGGGIMALVLVLGTITSAQEQRSLPTCTLTPLATPRGADPFDVCNTCYSPPQVVSLPRGSFNIPVTNATTLELRFVNNNRNVQLDLPMDVSITWA